jgi:hypothetical protein
MGFLAAALLLSTSLSLGMVISASNQREAAWGITGLIAAVLALVATPLFEGRGGPRP